MKNFYLKFKKWIIVCLLGGICLAGGLSLPNDKISTEMKNEINLLPIEIKDEISSKILLENEYRKDNIKYKEIPLSQTLKANIKYRVDEYVVWHGEGNEPDTGYQVYLFNLDGKVKSFGEGVLSKELSHNWETPKPFTRSIPIK